MNLMQPYDHALQEILETGADRTNKRTGIKTRSIFGMSNRYRLNTEYFPILTRRKVWPKSVFAELLWFLSGSTNNEDLKKVGCNFWTPWVDKEFETKNGFAENTFGPVYGFQLRHFGGYYGNGIGGHEGTQDSELSLNSFDQAGNPLWSEHSKAPVTEGNVYGSGGFDQLKWVVERIKEDSSCRRTLWTLWNPQDVAKMRLPPCHMLYQVLVDDERRLTGIMYQRSCDFPVGVPANIQFYSALTMMIAQQTDCIAHEFVHMTADSHVYGNQIQAVEQYLELPEMASPKLKINKAKDIFSYTLDDFEITDFVSGPKIEIPVAV
jgi:thymidylate synthase